MMVARGGHGLGFTFSGPTNIVEAAGWMKWFAIAVAGVIALSVIKRR